MYQRGKLFYADYYDAEGSRHRTSFPTKEAAELHEGAQRTKATRAQLKNQSGGRASRPSSANSPSRSARPSATPSNSRHVPSSPKRAVASPTK